MERGALKPTTMHQEFRVLRRMLNVEVRKKFLFANPCAVPNRSQALFRPHMWVGRNSRGSRLRAGMPAQRDSDHH